MPDDPQSSFDPYYTWLGVPPDERPIDHYRLLGIPRFEENPDVIANAVDQRMAHIRTFQTGKRGKYSQKILNELSKASVCLLKPEHKEAYDAKLRQFLVAQERNANIGKLMQVEKVRIEPTPLDSGDELTLAPLEAESLPSLDELADEKPAAPEEVETETEVRPYEVVKRQTSEPEIPEDEKFRNQLVWISTGAAAVLLLTTSGFLFWFFGGTNITTRVPVDPADVEADPESSQEQPIDSPQTDPSDGDVNPAVPDVDPPVDPDLDPENPTADPSLSPPGNPSTPSSTDDSNSSNGNQSPATTVIQVDAVQLPELEPKFNALRLRDKHRIELPVSGRFLQGEYTIELWVRCERKLGSYRVLGTLSRTGSSEVGKQLQGWAFDFDVTESAVQLAILEAREDLIHRTPIESLPNDESWHHLAIVSSDAQWQVFIDGRAASSRKQDYYLNQQMPPDLIVGAPPFSRNVMSFPGEIREFFISGSARYAADFKPSASFGEFPGGIVIWDFATPSSAAVSNLADIERPARMIGTEWIHVNGDTRTAIELTMVEPVPLDPVPEVDTQPNDTQPVDPRLPIPGDADLADRRLAVEQLYADEIDSARTSEQFAALAERMFQDGLDTGDDPGSRYVLFDQAAEFATRAGRYLLAWKILDQLEADFVTSAIEQRAKSLERASKRFDAHYEFKLGAKGWMRLVDEAIGEDRYTEARAYAAKANGSALRSFDNDFKRYADHGLKAIKQLMDAYELRRLDHKQVKEGLASSDESARWGRFLCEYKNAWSDGLKLWSQGAEDSDALARAAKLDMTNPADTQSQLQVANAWWSAHEQVTDILPKRFFAQRAVQWYQKAFGDLRGLNKTTAETRLRETELSEFMLDRGKAIDLIELMEPISNRGWIKKGNRLGVAQSASGARIGPFLVADGKYELQIVFARAEGTAEIGIRLPVGDDRVLQLLFGDQRRNQFRFAPITARDNQPAFVPVPNPLVSSKQHAMRIYVEPDGENAQVRVTWDGRPLVRWKGKLQQLREMEDSKRSFEISTQQGNTIVFDRIPAATGQRRHQAHREAVSSHRCLGMDGGNADP